MLVVIGKSNVVGNTVLGGMARGTWRHGASQRSAWQHGAGTGLQAWCLAAGCLVAVPQHVLGTTVLAAGCLVAVPQHLPRLVARCVAP